MLDSCCILLAHTSPRIPSVITFNTNAVAGNKDKTRVGGSELLARLDDLCYFNITHKTTKSVRGL